MQRLFLAVLAFGFATKAKAQGMAEDWQLGFQPAATPLMERVADFNIFLLVICTLISALVLGLMLYVMIRFRESRNPNPSDVTHNTKLEVIWTVIPALILLVIAVPSFRLLTYSETIPEFDITIKATGNQWYWSYEYPQEQISFDAVMLNDSALGPNQPRLLSTDMPVTVPVGKTIRVLVTAADVLHSWAMPAFGVKVDAVPGRINQLWFQAQKEGVYYGQCSELCGTRHSFMPIEVHVLNAGDYERWVARMQAQAAMSTAPMTMALDDSTQQGRP